MFSTYLQTRFQVRHELCDQVHKPASRSAYWGIIFFSVLSLKSWALAHCKGQREEFMASWSVHITSGSNFGWMWDLCGMAIMQARRKWGIRNLEFNVPQVVNGALYIRVEAYFSDRYSEVARFVSRGLGWLGCPPWYRSVQWPRPILWSLWLEVHQGASPLRIFFVAKADCVEIDSVSALLDKIKNKILRLSRWAREANGWVSTVQLLVYIL